MDPRSETQGWLTHPPSARYKMRTPVDPKEAGAQFGKDILAMMRHRDGVSCQNPAAYVYDANGHKRWCNDCGAELGEEASWHPEGDHVPRWWVGLLIAMVAAILFGVIMICAAWNSDHPFGTQPTSTPTTYGPPPTVVP